MMSMMSLLRPIDDVQMEASLKKVVTSNTFGHPLSNDSTLLANLSAPEALLHYCISITGINKEEGCTGQLQIVPHKADFHIS